MWACKNKGQREKTIARREQSIDRKFPGKKDNALQIAFTFYVIAIAAKLAKIDLKKDNGDNSAAEVESLKEVFAIPDEQVGKVEDFYMSAVTDNAPATHYARQLMNIFPKNRVLLEELTDDLLFFADADSPMTSGKVKFLKDIAAAFGFNDKFFTGALRKHMLVNRECPFAMLAVDENVSYVNLKKAYRKVVKDCHPDRFSGPDIATELKQIAREQFELYRQAYEAVKLKRGFNKKAS